MKELRGGSYLSSVPHIMANIVPRQIVEDGDPNRRCCEQSESIGVDLKFDLHKRCARNHTTKRVTRNSRGEIIKTWRGKLKISRVMQVQAGRKPSPLPAPTPTHSPLYPWYRAQVFNRACIRENLRRDAASKTFLQRRDHRIMLTGKSTKPKAEKTGDDNENKPPRYAAKTAVTEVLKQRFADGNILPRSSRER